MRIRFDAKGLRVFILGLVLGLLVGGSLVIAQQPIRAFDPMPDSYDRVKMQKFADEVAERLSRLEQGQ
jgi:hypothetical protein